MSFFLSLLSELQRGILGTWLSLDDVSRLDSACCCRKRQLWLDTLYSVTYDYLHSQFRRVRSLFIQSDSYYSHQLQIYWFMRWVALRSVRIT
jgi:hypothetical protein